MNIHFTISYSILKCATSPTYMYETNTAIVFICIYKLVSRYKAVPPKKFNMLLKT